MWVNRGSWLYMGVLARELQRAVREYSSLTSSVSAAVRLKVSSGLSIITWSPPAAPSPTVMLKVWLGEKLFRSPGFFLAANMILLGPGWRNLVSSITIWSSLPF